jgi:hypothetical protein
LAAARQRFTDRHGVDPESGALEGDRVLGKDVYTPEQTRLRKLWREAKIRAIGYPDYGYGYKGYHVK